MPGVATGEAYSWAEGKLYLFASASGTTSGSGIGFAENARLRLAVGFDDLRNANRSITRAETGRRADLTIGTLYADRTLVNLANAGAAVNAKFEAYVSAGPVQKSAVFWLYSGVIDTVELAGAEGGLFRGAYAMHANEWSAFGQ